MNARVVAGSFAVALALGCGGDADVPTAPPTSGPLPRGAVARVGDLLVMAESVGRIAAAQGCGVDEARDKAIFDALLAAAAEADGFGARRDVGFAAARVLAAGLLAEVDSEAAAVPIGADEIAAAVEQRWIDLDRPEGWATIHAVVRVAPDASDSDRTRARAVADDIARALAPVSEHARVVPAPERTDLVQFAFDTRGRPRDPVEPRFREAVKAVSPGGFELTVEPLPAVAADGRIIDRKARGGVFDATFARAASTLAKRGDLTTVATDFGLHVIMLLERSPSLQLSAEERSARVRQPILEERADAAERALLEALRLRETIDVAPNAEALLELPRLR